MGQVPKLLMKIALSTLTSISCSLALVNKSSIKTTPIKFRLKLFPKAPMVQSLPTDMIFWLKNINHVSFGRLAFKYNEDTNFALLGSVTDSLSSHFPGQGVQVSPNANMMNRMNGASEKDIVQSGLQYTMERSAKQIISRVYAYDLGLDVRSAAFILACEKVYNTTHQAGFSQ